MGHGIRGLCGGSAEKSVIVWKKKKKKKDVNPVTLDIRSISIPRDKFDIFLAQRKEFVSKGTSDKCIEISKESLFA